MDTDNVEEVETLSEEPGSPVYTESESARYLRVRAAAKEQAAIDMAANAKAAERAKAKRLGRKFEVEGQAEFLAGAKRIEAEINTPKEG
jgi:hypothetical protein